MEVLVKCSLVCVISLFCLYFVSSEDGVYDFKGLEVDKILSNKRLLDSHIKCYLDTGPCTPLLRKVKNSLTEVMGNKCEKCNENQLKQFRQAMTKVLETRPKEFEEIVQKYVPDSAKEFTEWLKK